MTGTGAGYGAGVSERDGTSPPLEQTLAAQRERALDDAPAREVIAAIADMVAHPDYPCLGARSVFRRDAATTVVLEDLTDTSPGGSLDRLGDLLRRYAARVDLAGDLVSFVACFRGPEPAGERAFEEAMWAALQHLHDRDRQPWAEGVSEDPVDPHFAFSVGGTAFFVVGLHPDASRVARRAPVPTLVFNLHEQFARLRADDRYTRMRDTIRHRDTELQGSPNPMVADHGLDSQARQYSGRAVPPRWAPPFVPNPGPRPEPNPGRDPEETSA